MNKYLIGFIAIVLITILYALGDLVYHLGFAAGERAGINITHQLYKDEYPKIITPGVPDTVYITLPPIKGKGNVKPKPDTSLIDCPPMKIDSAIYGKQGEIIVLQTGDARKDGINVYWDIPIPKKEIIKQTDTIRTMVPVEIFIEKPQPWYSTVYAGIGYGVAICLGVFAVSQ